MIQLAEFASIYIDTRLQLLHHHVSIHSLRLLWMLRWAEYELVSFLYEFFDH